MRILNTSADCELLTLRSEYLWTLGFDVESALANAEVLDVVGNGGSVELAVLCYTLSRDQKVSMMEIIRKSFPSTQILELYLAEAPVTSDAIEASGFRCMMKSLAACVAEPPLGSTLTTVPVARC